MIGHARPRPGGYETRQAYAELFFTPTGRELPPQP